MHRLDAAEIWHYYAGAAVELRIGLPDQGEHVYLLGPALDCGQRPQMVVPQGEWQQARSLGDFSLVGCTVSPAFEFSGFELAD